MNYLFGSYYIIKNKLINYSFTKYDIPRIQPKMPWYRQYSYFYYPSTQILNHLYLGSSFNAYDMNDLRSKNITIIINATVEIDNYYENDLNFVYYKYPIRDNNIDDISTILDDTYSIIDRQMNEGHNILVHCYMGASRSASIVIYYIMRKFGLSYLQALYLVTTLRPLVNLSIKFDQTLRSKYLSLTN